MPIFHKNRQDLQSAKTDKSQQILQAKTTENHSIFCQNLENAVEPQTKKSAFSAAKKSTIINKKHPQRNLTSTQAQTPPAPRKKFLKIFAAASLALITCATTLLAVAPFGASSATASAESKMTAQEKLAAGTLNLNPETDPVIYTTSSGLDIKFGGGAYTSGNFKGCLYITMGTINETPINWVIVGESTEGGLSGDIGSNYYVTEIFARFMYKSESFKTFYDTIHETITPAGSSISADNIENDSLCQKVTNEFISTAEILQNANIVANDEIPKGCVLICSEHNTGFPSSTYGATTYQSSKLKTAMEALYYENQLNLTYNQRAAIIPQTVVAYGQTTSTVENQYFFPLASRGENFNRTTYPLALKMAATGSWWWTRSVYGSNYGFAHDVRDANGTVDYNAISANYALRPMCVFKLGNA